MALDKSVIGRETEPELNEVEKGAIRKFADAIGDGNPLFSDEEAAAKGPMGAIVAPPTFATTLRAGGNIREGLDFDWKKLLHGEQHYEYHKPMKPGDKVYVKNRIADIYEKDGRSGTMDFLVIESIGTDEAGEKYFTAKSVLVIRR